MSTVKQIREQQKGQSLIELLLAMSIAIIAIGTLAYLIFNTQISIRQALETTKAQALAEEGLAAVRSMSQQAFQNLTEGTHGLVFQDGSWGFSGTEDISGKYTRTVTVTSIDDEMYAVTSAVAWDITPSRSTTVSYTTYISNWTQTKDNASDLTFNTSGATYVLGGTSLEGITIANTGISSAVTISEISIEWDGAPELSTVTIGGTVVYASTSPEVSSGELVDIDDIIIPLGGAPVDFGPIVFSSEMASTDILITAYLSDGSKRYARGLP